MADMDKVSRWLGILVLIGVNSTLEVMWFAYTPIPYETAEYFNVEVEQVNQISVACFLIYFFTHIVSVFLADRYGPGINVALSALIMVPVCGLRAASVLLTDKSIAFAMAFSASVLSMVSGGMCSILAAKMSSIWFPDNQRVLANSLAAIASQLGLMFSYVLAPTIVKEDHTQAQFQLLGFITVGMGVFCIICSILFLYTSNWTGLPQGAPPSESSRAILETIAVKDPDICGSLLSYYKSGILAFTDLRGFCMVTVLVALGLSIGTNLVGATPQIMCPYGYTKDISSIAVLVSLVVGGYIGVFICSYIAARWKDKSHILIKVCGAFGALTFWGLVLIMPTYQHEYLIVAIYFLFGLTLLPAIPLAHELAVECTYPMGAGLSSGMMNIVADLFGFVMGLVTYSLAKPTTDQNLIDNNACNLEKGEAPLDFTTSLYVLGAFFGAGVLVAMFFKCPYLRLEADKARLLQVEDKNGEVNPAFKVKVDVASHEE